MMAHIYEKMKDAAGRAGTIGQGCNEADF